MTQDGIASLQSNESVQSRVTRLVAACATIGPKRYIEGFSATNALTGERGFALRNSDKKYELYPFGIAESDEILAILRDVAATAPEWKAIIVQMLIDIVQDMTSRLASDDSGTH